MNVTFVRTFVPQLDSRMGKYVHALRQQGHTVSFIGWSRGRQPSKSGSRSSTGNTPRRESTGEEPQDDIILYPRPAQLGARWGNLMALLGWQLFVLKTLFARRAAIDVVHAVDLDSILPAWLFCRLSGKCLVFDIYDHYADTRSIQGIARSVLCQLERSAALHADLTLLADECRYVQHGLKHEDPVRVIENVPEESIEAAPLKTAEGGLLRIGYLGVLEPEHRGLETLLEVFAGQPGVELHFGGYGPLQERIMEAARSYSNVISHGPLQHAEGLRMLANMDCLVGFYYLTIPNHRYASPNKYYEHLMLGRPLLTTIGTPPGDKVMRHGTGWALPETADALNDWLAGVTRQELALRGHKAQQLWVAKYEHYVQNQISHHYVNTLQILCESHGRLEDIGWFGDI